MTDINLAIVDLDQFPEGWIETKGGKKRTQIGVGDVAAAFAGFYGGSWRFNLLSNRIELAGIPVKPQEIELLYSKLSLKGWTVSKNAAIDGARAAAYANSFNPVQEYLERIVNDDSITPADLNTIATTYFDTNDPLYDAMVRATLIGAVRRTFDPGCLYRTVLVFKGPQDIGKSSVVRNLASPDWVSDTSHDNDKDFMLSVHSAWIIELAELDSITSKKEAGKLKNLISSPKDSLRPPYGRAIETFPRRSILIGTSNRDDFLKDETGSSRWWVIELPHNADRGFHINHDRIRRDRDAIFKAAVLAHQAGELPVLTTEQQAESNRRNLGYSVVHPFEDFIVEWLEKPGAPAAFTTEEAAYLSGCMGDPENYGYTSSFRRGYLPPVAQKDAVEIGKILRRLGYVKDKHQRRENGKKQKRKWRRADDEVGHDINPPKPRLTEAEMIQRRREAQAYWDNSDASSASTPEPLPEAGQTPTGGSEVSDPPHVSRSFIEKEKGQEEEQMTAAALLGKTPEAPEAAGVGSGFDVQEGWWTDQEWWSEDLPNRSA